MKGGLRKETYKKEYRDRRQIRIHRTRIKDANGYIGISKTRKRKESLEIARR